MSFLTIFYIFWKFYKFTFNSQNWNVKIGQLLKNKIYRHFYWTILEMSFQIRIKILKFASSFLTIFMKFVEEMKWMHIEIHCKVLNTNWHHKNIFLLITLVVQIMYMKIILWHFSNTQTINFSVLFAEC